MMYNRDYPTSARRWGLVDYDQAVTDGKNLEVSQRMRGKLTVSITISGVVFGIDLTPDQAEDLADGLHELSGLVRTRDTQEGLDK